jgi:hypothetical protein
LSLVTLPEGLGNLTSLTTLDLLDHMSCVYYESLSGFV